MERLVALVEAVFDEGMKHTVVLVHIAEERADVAVSVVESVRRDLKRSVGAFHASPPSGDRRVQQLSVYPLATSARLLLWIQGAAGRTKSSFAASESSGSALRLDSERAEAPRLLLRLPSVKRARLSGERRSRARGGQGRAGDADSRNGSREPLVRRHTTRHLRREPPRRDHQDDGWGAD